MEVETVDPIEKFITGKVLLERRDVEWAFDVAFDRNDWCVKNPDKCKQFTHGNQKSKMTPLQQHQLGCLGELAFSNIHGVVWPASVNTFKHQRDVAQYEVRARSFWNHDLLVRPDDPEAPYALMTACRPYLGEGNMGERWPWSIDMFDPSVLFCCGWLSKREAAREEWIQDWGDRGAPVYSVKQVFLRDRESIPIDHVIEVYDDYKLARDLRIMRVDEERRWRGVKLAPPPTIATITSGPYKGFKMSPDSKPDPARAKKCYDELVAFQEESERLQKERKEHGYYQRDPGSKRSR